MKLTLSNVKEIKRNSDSPLTKRVCNYVIGRWGDYNDKEIEEITFEDTIAALETVKGVQTRSDPSRH